MVAMSSVRYAPSEAAIEDAIESRIGSPGFFQRVAEQVARGLYPHSAAGLVPFGRRSDDKTVRGWPDAYFAKSDGALVAIEATTAESAITRHWPKDLAKLQENLESRFRGGLIWVAWCDPKTPSQLSEMREEARHCGLPAEDIQIIFRKDLCSRLRAPVHAGFWTNDLGLAVTSEPFDRIYNIVERYGYRVGTGLFPTSEEYERSYVHAPPILEEVEKTLSVQRNALVVGHGAAGKTTLAMVLAHRPRFRLAPTYYLDLTATESDPTLLRRTGEAIAALADRGVLFVVDNAHLDPGLTVRIREQWESYGRQSELLILSRRVRGKTEPWSTEPELESLPLPTFDLIIEPADLEGVYQRLYRARKHSEAVSLEPDVLDAWHKVFGGDLMTFGAAVLGLLDRNGDPSSLSAADARAFVRNRYLQDVKLSSEQSALLDLASVSEREGLLPVEAFADGALEQSVRDGLVWVETRGRGNTYHFYRLSHPGLGTLLRDAAHCAETSLIDCCRVLQAHPYSCVSTAFRRRKIGEPTEAAALLDALWRQPGWPLANLPLSWWRGFADAASDLGVATHEEIASRAHSWLAKRQAREALVEGALATPLHSLASFLDYARVPMPAVWDAIHQGLAAEDHREALIKHALATPLGDLRSFLDYARVPMTAVWEAIHEGLAAEDHREALVERALATPLHFLASFLEYARKPMPAVWDAIHEGLAAEDHREALVERALATPLGDLRSFLDYARGPIPAVWEAIHEGLAAEGHREALVERALATPLDHLASFLAYARVPMTAVRDAMRDGLLSEPCRADIQNRFIADGPEKIVALLKHDDAFDGILRTIDTNLWSSRYNDAYLGQPNWFNDFASQCYRAEREDLVGPIACAILRNSQSGDFPAPGINLRHLTFILTAPHGCIANEVDDFFARVLGPDWVATQYGSREASVGALAASVRSIALSERSDFRRHFLYAELYRRLIEEAPTDTASPRHIEAWLCLLSATRILGHGQELDFRTRISSSRLAKCLTIFPPGRPDEDLRPIQAGIWSGLREWCHLTREKLTVDPVLAEGILAQFRAASPVGRPRLSALNAVMIDWLERSRDCGWRLLADEDSLLGALEHRLHTHGPSDVGNET